MPVQHSYPGVYVEELPSGVHPITGVATSITAFVGRTARGPENTATTILSYADFENQFGGLDVNSPVGFAVRDFFLNGGNQAVVVRLFHRDVSDAQIPAVKSAIAAVVAAVKAETDVTKVVATATKAQPPASASQAETDAAAKIVAAVTKAAGVAGAKIADVKSAANDAATQNTPVPSTALLTLGTAITLQALSPGTWGQYLRGQIDFNVSADAIKAAGLVATPWKLFNLTLRDSSPGGAVEVYQNLTTEDKPNRIDRVLTNQSSLVEWNDTFPIDTTTIQWAYNNTSTASALENAAVLLVQNDELALSQAQQTLKNAKDADKDATQKASDVATAKLQTDLKALVDLFAKFLSDPLTAAQAAVDAVNTNLQLVLTNPTSQPADKTAARQAVQDATAFLNTALQARAAGLTDGGDLAYGDFIPNDGQANKQGIYALETTDLFNLLCLPTFTSSDTDVLANAVAYCQQRRAVLIVDCPPSATAQLNPASPITWKDANAAVGNSANTGFTDSPGFPGFKLSNAAMYFPRVKYPNPLKNGIVEEFPPCGVIAGLYAQTDTTRGVWKAPAGTAATLLGVQELAVKLTDGENGLLNPLGLNCLRSFPAAGRVIWGARTLKGSDQLADDYKYVPVRRLALYIEESLYRGTQWAVFEPNDAPLWGQLRLNIGSFMHDLFRQGAFQGSTPKDAYLVKCDGETTTQSDINNGVVNVLVAFAPLKPAEFVVLQIQQLAGQLDT